MENCIYQGKTICTYDLKDNSGYYYENLVLDWKQAAADRLLHCAECGAPVYLAAGLIKEPYFAHYDLEDCEYGSGQESEELKKGKRLLYQLLKRSFPSADIRARFRMGNGMYSTLYCILEDGRSFAADYRLQNNSLDKFRERDNYHQVNHVKPIYVMGKKQEKDTKQIDWYQSLIQTSQGYLIFLEAAIERITLKKSFGYRLGNERSFRYCCKSYPIQEIAFSEEGSVICDFTSVCDDIERQIQDEKIQYIRRKEQMKRLQEESLQGLNPIILEKCRKMIEEGNGHLVSKKYYEAIIGNQ